MSTEVKIIASLDGTDQVNSGLRSMGNTATALQAQINSALGGSVDRRSAKESADVFIRESKRVADFHNAETERILLSNRRRFMSNFNAGNGMGGLSGRREFMAGQRLQSTLTGALGIDNGLTRTIDGFERLNYMAQASNMSIGQFFKTVGPGALATAGAVGGITMAWSAWGKEADKVNKELIKQGYEAMSAWQWTKSLFGFGEGNKVDAGNMAKKIMAEKESLTVQQQLAQFIAANRGAGEDAYRAERDRLLALDEANKKAVAFGERMQSIRKKLDTPEAPDMAGASVEEKIKRWQFLQSAIEDLQKWIAEGGAGGQVGSALADDLERKIDEAKKIKAEIDSDLRQRETKRLKDREDALRPWVSEMQQPKGFASTTLSNSIEGVRAVALAATMGERTDATQRALAEQVRLLEDIRTNTGNQNQTVTVGAL